MTPLLEVKDLAVRYDDEVDALRGVSLSLERGSSVAVVGETGSGKSTLALCLAGLVQPPQARGSVRLDGEELMGAPPERLRALRWERVAVALQGAPFNPVVPVGVQVAEPLRQRLGLGAGAARQRADQAAAGVLLDPSLLDRYPHELSGGERRRAMLAMALILDPDLLVLDEPTAGLDPVTRAELVERVRTLTRDREVALVVISHDLPDAAGLARQTMVLYGGQVMEVGAPRLVLEEPAHPYTWGLVNAYPVMSTTKDLRPIRGHPPDPRALPPGCPFFGRCTQGEDRCREETPPLAQSRGRLVACHFGGLRTLLSAVDVHKSFGKTRAQVRALQGVSIELRESEAIGIVGASGSGKSTLARILTGQLAPDAGSVLLGDIPLTVSWRRSSRELRRRIQLVMQDPWDALSPRLTVAQLVREPLDLARDEDRRYSDAAVAEALESVGLPSSTGFLEARTHQLSGGQLQRIALARALVVRPKVLVADEPTSMLDASEQARLLVVLRERQTEMGLGLIIVSHDIAVVRKVTDRIVVLDAGRVVEEGPSRLVSTAPRTIAARDLIEAAPAFSYDDGDEQSGTAAAADRVTD